MRAIASILLVLLVSISFFSENTFACKIGSEAAGVMVWSRSLGRGVQNRDMGEACFNLGRIFTQMVYVNCASTKIQSCDSSCDELVTGELNQAAQVARDSYERAATFCGGALIFPRPSKSVPPGDWNQLDAAYQDMNTKIERLYELAKDIQTP